jgi:hypothetical protein
LFWVGFVLIWSVCRYQVAALELIKAYEQEQELCLSKLLLAERTTGQHSRKQFLVPVGPDLAKDKEYAIRAASWGLEVCLIYIRRESFVDICWQKL